MDPLLIAELDRNLAIDNALGWILPHLDANRARTATPPVSLYLIMRDLGTGCGKRCAQMIMSHLVATAPYAAKLSASGICQTDVGGHIVVPSPDRLEELKQESWRLGWDLASIPGAASNPDGLGSLQLWAILLRGGISTSCMIFTRAPGGTHDALYAYLLAYFSHSDGRNIAPVFIESDVHARVVVGVEIGENGSERVEDISLLFFESYNWRWSLENSPMEDSIESMRSKLCDWDMADTYYRVVVVDGVQAAGHVETPRDLVPTSMW